MISDIFDLCLPTSHEVREEISAYEDSSAGWSGGRAAYRRSFRIYTCVWDTMTFAQSKDLVRHWNAMGSEVRSFEALFPGDERPVRVRFYKPPELTYLSYTVVRVTAEFEEVI